MTIIKHIDAARLTRDAVVLDLGDLRSQGNRLIAAAREKADQVIREACAESQRLIDEASGKGHEQGLAQGLAEGREQGRQAGRQEVLDEFQPRLETLLDAWTAALGQWEEDRAEMFLAARGDVLQFALEMARKIVLRTIENEPGVIRDQLAETLTLVASGNAAVVHVHPEDRALLAEVLPDLLAALDRSGEVRLREDGSITRGGCVVSCEGGRIDATIETQIQRIVDALVPRRAAAASPDPGDEIEREHDPENGTP